MLQGGRRPDIDAAIKSAAFFGCSIVLDEGAEEAVGLWEEHLPAWNAWCEISGQWRTTALMSDRGSKVVWIGLDYAAARAGLDLAGISITPECWSDIRLIEAGALKELNRNGR